MHKTIVSRVSTRKRRRSVLNSSRTPTAESSPKIKQSCSKSSSVKLTNLISDMHNSVRKLENEVKSLTEFQALVEPLLDNIMALSYIINAPSQPSATTATNSTKLIHTIATEVSLRIKAARNVVVFNVPDRVPIQSARLALLQHSGMMTARCTCLRLRKKTQKHTCPLLFMFDNETQAQLFINNQQLLRQLTPYKNIVLMKDRTRLERMTATTKLTPVKSQGQIGDLITSPISTSTNSPSLPTGRKPQISPCKTPITSASQNSTIPVDLDRTLSPSSSPVSLDLAAPTNVSTAEASQTDREAPELEPPREPSGHPVLSLVHNQPKSRRKPSAPPKIRQNISSPSLSKISRRSLLGSPPIPPLFGCGNSFTNPRRSNNAAARYNFYHERQCQQKSPLSARVSPHHDTPLGQYDMPSPARMQNLEIPSLSHTSDFLSAIMALTKPPPIQPPSLMQLLGLAQLLHLGRI